MYCSECGAQISPGTRACSNCAAAAGNLPVASPTPMASVTIPAGSRDDIVHTGLMPRLVALLMDKLIIAISLIVLVWLADSRLGVFTKVPDRFHPLWQVGELCAVLWWVVAPLYFAGMESSPLQATIGKRVLGIKVTDASGQRIGFGLGFRRWIAAALSYMTLCVGFLMVGFNRRKRALHDVIADTFVVDRWAYSRHPERQDRYGSDYRVGTAIAICLVPIVAMAFAIFLEAFWESALHHLAIQIGRPPGQLQ
jgi:uncharacterized RDD family membrane protein YckC